MNLDKSLLVYCDVRNNAVHFSAKFTVYKDQFTGNRIWLLRVKLPSQKLPGRKKDINKAILIKRMFQKYAPNGFNCTAVIS